ncbi:unnamed protein product, partial [Durusdinium trenchii]
HCWPIRSLAQHRQCVNRRRKATENGAGASRRWWGTPWWLCRESSITWMSSWMTC